MKDIKEIVIVGGGSSGWMTAATLIKVFPDKKITVIESKDYKTIGVGESTLGSFNDWLSILGIVKESFMKECDASYKLSIKFEDFYDIQDGGFHYPFGQPLFEHKKEFGTPEDWTIKNMIKNKSDVLDYVNTFYSSSSLINNNKYTNNYHGKFDNFNPAYDSTVHFDAVKFGIWLKNNVCIPNGVSVINKTVTNINTDINGINEIILDDGEVVSADLYIDCTGFKSILLNKIGESKFIDYSNIIPNNTAWATRIPYTDKESELEPYTTCTALDNGWAWNIPLWSRIGAGYVFSNKFITKEEALEEFKNYILEKFPKVDISKLEFNEINFRVGIHDKTWVKNVVAIGLSAGFIEPLESNGLFTVHEFLIKLCSVIERGKISQWDIDSYNTITFNQYNDFASFVAMHYALSVRSNSEYWKDITSKTFFNEIINHEFTNKTLPMDLVIRKFMMNSWGKIGYVGGGSQGLHCIATGMRYNIFPSINIFFRNRNIDLDEKIKDLEETWESYKNKWDGQASLEMSLNQYLKNRIYND